MRRAVLCLFLAAGCTHARGFVGPDGERGYVVKCGGWNSMASCYNRASEVCGGKYRVANQSEAFVSNEGYVMAHRELTVLCAN